MGGERERSRERSPPRWRRRTSPPKRRRESPPPGCDSAARGKLHWYFREASEQIKEWQGKELCKGPCSHSREELRRAEERVEEQRRKGGYPVSAEQFKDLVLVQDRQQAKERVAGGSKYMPRRTPRGYDSFACDKYAYEWFNRAVDEGRPLGLWVKRMLQAGCLFTDVNYLERPGWGGWPYDGAHVCSEKARRYLRAMNIEDQDSQERLLPSMLAYLQANLRSGNYGDTVFVTGCREFYERVLMSKPAMQRLLDAFLYRWGVLLKPGNLMVRVWYVSPDQKVPNSADEVLVGDGIIPRPRRDKSAFLPEELASATEIPPQPSKARSQSSTSISSSITYQRPNTPPSVSLIHP